MKSLLRIKDKKYILIWAKKIKAIETLGGKCNKCGNNNIYTLDFHHRDKDDKINMNILRDKRWSIIEKEIKKCILLCRNCHTELHNDDSNLLKNKLLEIMNCNSCSKCGYSGRISSCLDFHHIDEKNKEFRISRAYAGERWKIPLEKIILELDKCIVVCRNCHSVIHNDLERFKKFENLIRQKMGSYKEIPIPYNQNEIIKMYNGKIKLYEIAKAVGCSKATVSNVLKKNKIQVISNRNKPILIKCKECEKEFEVSNCDGETRIFCSAKCRYHFARKKWATKKQLLIDINNSMSWASMGRKYKVSEGLVRYWVKSYGIVLEKQRA